MCDATSLAVVAVASVVVGTGVTIYGQYQQGQFAKERGKYLEQVGDANAKIADHNAHLAARRGSLDAAREGLATRRLIGRQRASLAGKGVLVDEGTAAEVVADAAEFGHLEAQTKRYNADIEAFNQRLAANAATAQGQLAQYEGSYAQAAANINMTSTALSGFGQVANQWYTYKTAS